MSHSKIWQIRGKIKEKKSARRREAIFKVVLKNRGINTSRKIEQFLEPKKPADFSLTETEIDSLEIDKAAAIIKTAIEDEVPIVVFGDYDTDGICATAIVWETLASANAKVMPFIPHRDRHGYGLSIKAIKEIITDPKYGFKDKGVIVTVDNGIVAHEAVNFARKKGLQVIITDHHQKKKTLPKAEAIVHSLILSGSGVAYFFTRELIRKLKIRKLPFCLLELATIGTLADIMPLQGVNRSLVKFGLESLRETSRTGLKALFKIASIDPQLIDVYGVSFLISPRINAMGRISDSLSALRLICTQNEKSALGLATILDKTNRLRQDIMEQTFLHAKEAAVKQAKEKLIFLTDEHYNQGIIGLVAGKLSEFFYRPVIVTTKADGFVKGSARSIRGFNIIKALRRFEDDFIDLGGHKLAAGFSIKQQHLRNLKKKIQDLARKKIRENNLLPRIMIDCQIKLQDLTRGLYFLLEKISPFGLENPRPLFLTTDVKIIDLKRVGRDQQHLKLFLDDPDTPKLERALAESEAIGFGLGPQFPDLKIDDKIDIVYSLDLNFWNGQEKLQLKVKDIRVR